MTAGDEFGSVGAGDAQRLPSVSDLKDHASRAASDARGTLNALATEARDRVNETIQNGKAAGADRLSGYARAAQTAAGELEGTSPAVARLVRDAAGSVDQFAGQLRGGEVREVLDTVTRFARQQPLAFFAGSVLAGLALARFLKSDAPPAPPSAAAASATPAVGGESGFRAWSEAHPDRPA